MDRFCGCPVIQPKPAVYGGLLELRAEHTRRINWIRIVYCEEWHMN